MRQHRHQRRNLKTEGFGDRLRKPTASTNPTIVLDPDDLLYQHSNGIFPTNTEVLHTNSTGYFTGGDPKGPLPKPDPDGTLMDKVHKWSFKQNVMGLRVPSEAQQVAARMRAKLRQAERFVLDDEATKLVCHLSHQTDKFNGWAFLARLPHNPMWIEFSLHAKVREFELMGTLGGKFKEEEVAKRVGLLLYHDEGNEKSPRWICHEFYEYPECPMPGLVDYVFDPEGEQSLPISGSRTWHNRTLSLIPGFPAYPVKIQHRDSRVTETSMPSEYILCGVFEPGKTTINKTGLFIPGSTIEPATWFKNRSAVTINPWWTALNEYRIKSDPIEWYSQIANDIKEQRGAFRWVVALLAAINGLPKDVKTAATRSGTRAAGVHKLAYLGHRTVSINIPRSDRVVWARKQLDRAARVEKRLRHHTVMSHWRVIERGKKRKGMLIRGCDHSPTMVESGVGICTKCEMLVRWIELPNGRGDPNLGVVDRTYKIRAKRRR
jgi:hypothetical protein